MKKTVAIFTLLACLFVISAIPAYANNSMRNNSVNTPMNDVTAPMNNIGAEFGQDVNRRLNSADRTLGNNGVATPDRNLVNNSRNNNYRNNAINDNYNYRTNANNYRTTAANNNGMGWGWLGLLGLIGLAGLRNRDRDRA